MARFTKYRTALEKVGLKQLDVYRYRDRDVVRVMRIFDQRVFVIELPRHREEMSVEEFVEFVRSRIASR